MVRRGEITDQAWQEIEPLLPEYGQSGGQWRDHRTVINGILWVLRTGCPWRALPERYGSWKTASSRFYRWQRAGIWDRVLAAVQRRADAEGRLDWTLHFVDSTVVRAHQHAAGAKGGPSSRSPRPESRRLHDEGASGLRRAWAAARGRRDAGAAAREHPARAGPRCDSRAAPG